MGWGWGVCMCGRCLCAVHVSRYGVCVGPAERPQAGDAELGGGHKAVRQGPSRAGYLRNKTASLGS